MAKTKGDVYVLRAIVMVLFWMVVTLVVQLVTGK